MQLFDGVDLKCLYRITHRQAYAMRRPRFCCKRTMLRRFGSLGQGRLLAIPGPVVSSSAQDPVVVQKHYATLLGWLDIFHLTPLWHAPRGNSVHANQGL